MRGLISMQILRKMEALLGGGDPSYRLSDTFDYVAGTSTGAIIAAGIAMRHPVAEIEEMYVHLGPKIFRRRWVPAWWRSMYRDRPVSDELKGFFGASTTLGDDRLRSLLMVVLHRTDTDSVWPLTNVSGAKYNNRARHDCNLDMNLWQVIRGSTAAPFYFPPEEVPLPPPRRHDHVGAVRGRRGDAVQQPRRPAVRDGHLRSLRAALDDGR